MTRPCSDQPARDRIRTDLATNMLVEAGAGSGKTTALVERMLQHVRTGTPVDRLAAVTFTRKAANELRERFQMRLETALRDDVAAPGETEFIERALHDLDHAFLGTIHSFCARLLREHPLEVSLDPSFRELSEEDWEELARTFWRRWVARAVRSGDTDVGELFEVGVDPRKLYDGFRLAMTFSDVEFPVADRSAPDIGACRQALEKLLDDARVLIPADEPTAGWDELMSLIRRLEFKRGVSDWSQVAAFCAELEDISLSHCKTTQNRWSNDKQGKADAKQLGESFTTFLEGSAADVLRCWREHRYPKVMRVLNRATQEFARERRATGRVGFDDLLYLAAGLLREHPSIRDQLGARYAHLLVDEFQDTDPVQAELCFLLASDSSTGSDWRSVTPRAGSLFVVGDPKQSIYRFRRADIQVYDLVKQRMRGVGVVLSLTSNFRSVSSIEAVVNGHFEKIFPAGASAQQAAYSPMETLREPMGADGVYRYTVRPDSASKECVFSRDAAMLASWVSRRVASGERLPGDFLILTERKDSIAAYARALAERNIPVVTTGAQLPRENELQELLVVLRAIADPENQIAVVAALEGLLFGLSPADLFDAAQAGVGFVLTRPPATDSHRVGQALLQLHHWWSLSRIHAADVLLERILDDSGLLFHAAGLPLGDARAGALLHLVEILRASPEASAMGITDAMDRLTLILDLESPDASLRPARTGAVRVMNLHKAKGLESDVVVLAAPYGYDARDPAVHVTRSASGAATGALCVGYGLGNNFRAIAQPPGWAGLQNAERGFVDAERARLLYVAATRARRELVVAQCEIALKTKTNSDESAWRPLASVLDDHALVIELPITIPEGRRAIERSVESLRDDALAAAERVRAASVATYQLRTVTETAAESAPNWDPAFTAVRGGGAAWGRAVHRSIEALVRGRRGDSLIAFARAVARDEGLSSERTAELGRMLAGVERSEIWRRLQSAGEVRAELRLMRVAGDNGGVTITEGVIDAAVLGTDGWQIVDWKTDGARDDEWNSRRARYEGQVESYAVMLSALTGQAARGTIERLS